MGKKINFVTACGLGIAGLMTMLPCAVVLLGLLSPALAGGATAPPFRDLNGNQRLDPYEDRRLPAAQRADDLLSRMTLEEKVGAMLHGALPSIGAGGGTGGGGGANGYDLAAAKRLIIGRHVSSFITRQTLPPAEFARQNNAVQRIAEQGRLGIPVTISTDPRHHFEALAGASTAGGFSQWPETLGFAALRDPALVRRFADIARREYRAVGIHMALSPQADLATEPRWPRFFATFGSEPALVSALAGAYVQGFQGGDSGLTRGGVATVVKHWVGYGAAPEGFDAHSHYGRTVRLEERSFEQHVASFRGALAAGPAGVMPSYAIIEGVSLHGKPLPPVGAGFSRPLLTGLLRGKHHFGGMILSDWGITNACPETCRSASAERHQAREAIAMPWGVEELSTEERFALGVNSGVDQFGGVDDPAPLLAALRGGRVSARQIDESVRRVLLIKFQLGLFDDPYVDPAEAERIVGSRQSQAEADSAQRKALVLLENRDAVIPLRGERRVFLHDVGHEAAKAAGLTIVEDPRQADVAILRIRAPFEKLHPYYFFGNLHHEGRLDYRDGDPDYEVVKRVSASVPTVVIVDMDRPVILSNIRDKARAILAAFGANDSAVLDVLTGRATAGGRLPFELPSSMAEVERQDPAKPDDTTHPLYPRGAGIILRNPGEEAEPARKYTSGRGPTAQRPLDCRDLERGGHRCRHPRNR
jgi:beta-glucosidase